MGGSGRWRSWVRGTNYTEENELSGRVRIRVNGKDDL